MIEHRPFASLGHMKLDWLDANYHFSFANYHEPARMSWGALRVWNDDVIQPGTGFPPHPHDNMEIITYVRSGALSHRDSMGNEGVTGAGDVQVMSAGRGVRHSEYNQGAEPTHSFQLWIQPGEVDGEPYWANAKFPKDDRAGKLVVLASGRKEDRDAGALPIRQDARLIAATLAPGQAVTHRLDAGRGAYLVAASGAIEVKGANGAAAVLAERDAAAIHSEPEFTITAREAAEIVMVDTV